ncbi:MAG: nucleotide exchange factor GrpE [Myxococcales bacterium]|nr:nucleotide exchange factor GrpE [Myxococcales bacterium]
MTGDSNGTPDVDGEAGASDTTIPVEVVSADAGTPAAAAGDAGGDEVAQLKARIEALEADKKDSWDKLLRTAADLENLRKRQRREVDDAKLETKSRVLREMLPVADNLERALGVSAGDGEALLDGVRLVQRQFLQALERLEVTPIEAEHQPFDPNLHEAISQQETEEHPPGTVIAVLQRGYKSAERLLRPSLVVVAKAKAG